MLVVLDGWGIGKRDESNPIFAAHPENILYAENNFPAGALQASGMAVGLPWDEEGNSEIGHLTIGAGKVLYQYYSRISLAIENGTFFSNPELKSAFAHAKKNGSTVHLIGLIGEGVVHSALSHLYALIKMAKAENYQNLVIHAFSDGRDSSPRSAIKLIELVSAESAGTAKVASVSGRYYAMDRDKHWDRTWAAYKNLTAHNKTCPLKEGIESAYSKGMNDEYVAPFSISGSEQPIRDNDSVIFFNFREDRMRQIYEAFMNKNFSQFETIKFNNLRVVTMTEYIKGADGAAFKEEIVEDTLGKVISSNGKTQLRIAETEKYAHITYFFNGRREKPYTNEYRVLIPSRNTPHYEDCPEMMASEITDRAVLALDEGGFDFVLVNYANTDIVAHTGKYGATVEAVRTVDREIGRLMKSALAGNHVLFITSDHGNAESVMDPITGEEETKHNPNPVPFYIVCKEFAGRGKNSRTRAAKIPTIGILSDVAPTVLAVMGMEKPQGMTGQNLLDQML
ncbi:MAG: 2,3-bisphosphoglycerate-independent phosphoglycerate mutase [Candidatus Jorgensenbacteria bacterium GW2011_GWA2_45_9]|nr:MAG: 2,3-bisphosphoglycerate-independent phosphoglycerate mutase [Candidatus Jorgensenbacteria bacterium GW2011_GWA2_45_9]